MSSNSGTILVGGRIFRSRWGEGPAMICRHLTKTGLASNKFVEQSDKTVRLWPDMSGIIRVIWALLEQCSGNGRPVIGPPSDPPEYLEIQTKTASHRRLGRHRTASGAVGHGLKAFPSMLFLRYDVKLVKWNCNYNMQ